MYEGGGSQVYLRNFLLDVIELQTQIIMSQRVSNKLSDNRIISESVSCNFVPAIQLMRKTSKVDRRLYRYTKEAAKEKRRNALESYSKVRCTLHCSGSVPKTEAALPI